MRATANVWAFVPLLLLPCIAAVVVPFDNAGLGLDRRGHNTCPRITGRYEFCDDITKCCQPGYGCNTCGQGNVGQTCVKRQKDGCKSDADCYHTQKCIDNGKEPSFCAQLWVDDLPKPGEKKSKKTKKPKKPMPMQHSSMAPSSMIMAPSSMIMAPSSMIMAPSSMVMAPPTGMPKAGMPMPKPKVAAKPPTPSKEQPSSPTAKHTGKPDSKPAASSESVKPSPAPPASKPKPMTPPSPSSKHDML